MLKYCSCFLFFLLLNDKTVYIVCMDRCLKSNNLNKVVNLNKFSLLTFWSHEALWAVVVFVTYNLESDQVFLSISLKEVINAFKVSFNVSCSEFVSVERADPVFDCVSAVPKCLTTPANDPKLKSLACCLTASTVHRIRVWTSFSKCFSWPRGARFPVFRCLSSLGRRNLQINWIEPPSYF